MNEKNKISNEQNAQTNETEKKNNNKDQENLLNLLPCDHYEYEFRNCTSFRNKLYNYYMGVEKSAAECDYYNQLFVACVKYKHNPAENFDSLLKLNKYESELVERRAQAARANDVWQLRRPNEPPSDWNAKLPDWCEERLKDTYWYKSAKK